ncbi:Ig-like domain-containing protein [Citrobacter sp. Awk 4]|nr:Ig-like domain-containing protein [Citrobacter sp. Awk 4]MDA8481362.1 Ig-like domain-containing protein [Citrobacter sp. Awk 4]
MATFVASAVNKVVVTLDLDNNDIAADGTTQLKAHVTLTDTNRNPVPNVAVSWSSDGSAIVASADANTNASGISNVTLTDLKAERVILTATASGKTSSKPVNFVAGAATKIEVMVDDNNITADGSAPLKAHATVTDANSNPVPNVAVSWASDGSATITSADANTSASGVSNVTVTDQKAEQVNLTATANGKTDSKPATFVDTAVATITINVLNPNGIADGSTSIAAQALVKNAQGQPVPDGTVITWSADNAKPATITSTTQKGVANTSFTSQTVGDDTLVATADNNIKGSSQVTFAALVFGHLTFVQPVPNGTADNTPLTLTVELLDSSDIPIGGATINWSTADGNAKAAGLISTTNQDGLATMDYSSGVFGYNTVSAKYDGHVATQQLFFT